MNAATRMASDVVRATCVVVVMAVAAGLVVETRLRLAAIDVAHRASIPQGWVAQPSGAVAAQPVEPPGPLRRLGIASLNLGEAFLGVVR